METPCVVSTMETQGIGSTMTLAEVDMVKRLMHRKLVILLKIRIMLADLNFRNTIKNKRIVSIFFLCSHLLDAADIHIKSITDTDKDLLIFNDCVVLGDAIHDIESASNFEILKSTVDAFNTIYLSFVKNCVSKVKNGIKSCAKKNLNALRIIYDIMKNLLAPENKRYVQIDFDEIKKLSKKQDIFYNF
jgi:hypothetical protein